MKTFVYMYTKTKTVQIDAKVLSEVKHSLSEAYLNVYQKYREIYQKYRETVAKEVFRSVPKDNRNSSEGSVGHV